jgi:drug/metabolite transporter (DMT)-like permease
LTQLLLLLAVVIWGATFVASKFCLSVMSPLQLVAWRFLLAAPSLFVVAWIRGVSFRLGEHRKVLFFASALFSFHYLLQSWALEYTTATNSGWLVTVSPLTIAVLAATFLREPMPPAAGIVLASVGIVLLVSKGELASLLDLSSVGDCMVVASTFTWSVFTIITRNPSRALDPVVVTLIMTVPLAASALVLPFAVEGWTPWRELGLETGLVLAFLGFAGVALAQWLWQNGVAKLGAARASMFLYLEPLATTALAVPVLGEPFGPWTAAGGILVLLGVFFARRN